MKHLAEKFGLKMVVMIVALISVAAVPTEAKIGHSAASSDGEDGKYL